jgi:putative transposase
MTDIIALTHGLAPYISRTNLRQLRPIIFALLCIPGRVTTLGRSGWTERGGSYRTLQRWVQLPLDWGLLLGTVVRMDRLDPNGV